MTRFQEKIADLSPARKAALFDHLRKKRQAADLDLPHRIARRSSSAPPPLSFGQLRLWFLDRLSPGDPTYNVPSAVDIRGILHVPSLALALAGVADRHEALRTTFAATEGDEPVQVIAPCFVPRLPVIDLEALPAGARDAELRRWTAMVADLPFDLEAGPLLRASLFRAAGDHHLILLVMHHSVSDGWSMGVLVQEVGALYAALLAGRPSPLPELAIQYADFAVWERHVLSGERLAHLIDIWRRRLAGAPATIPLPADRPRPPVRTSAGENLRLAFPPRAAARLAALAQNVRGTFFMSLLTAWNALLFRVTGETDLVVGTPVANRRPETADLIGFFVNTLALRCDLSGDPPFEELLARVREVTLEAFANQALPFEKLVEELRPERDPSRTPLFQVMCTLQNTPVEPLELEGILLKEVGAGASSAKFDLTLGTSENGEELSGSLTYWTALFDAATIDRLGRCFTALLAAALETPGQRISQLPILRPEEVAELTGGWATPALPAPAGGLVHERIAAWAALDPERAALRGEDGEITYGELGRRAGELAGRLRALGVGPEVRVAVTGTRTASTVVGIVAVLEAGGAYVPLDPALPAARREALLEEAGCAVLLDQSAAHPLAPASPASPLPVLPENAAYVLFTSGSTGTPKGVAVEHRQLTQYVDGAVAVLGLPSGARYALVSTLAADLGHTSLFPALVTGGCLDVVPEESVLDPEAFARHLERHPADCLKIVPSHLAALLGSSRPALALPRQRLILGGEPASIELARRLRELAPDLAVFNHYGPTETTVGAIAGPLSASSPPPFPLGRPLPGVHVLLLGTVGELVPPGVVGEIHIGGGGVARGYLGRPGLTAERFVPDPFSVSGGRLYRTGDLARLTPDGLVWLGRADLQVKIRGFRVEPGEVEAALAREAGVGEAVVLVHEDSTGDRRLFGYVVPRPGADLSAMELRSALRRSLPEAMVPAEIVILESLPLTANGKVDRPALARIAPTAAREESSFIAPQGPTEERLAQIWAEVLAAGRPGAMARIGAHDDFFNLGGHSLLATRVISRIRESFGVEMPLRVVFEAPTVAGLAARIEREGIGRIRSIDRASHTADLPLSFAQQRLWLIDQLDPGNPAYNVPLAVRLTGDGGELSLEALEQTFAELMRRHTVLRTTFAIQDGEPVQVIAPPGSARPELRVLDLSNAPQEVREERARQLALDEARAPFDLQRGPLLRLTLLRLGGREHLLLITLHHIVSDGWSMSVLLREIGALYPAFLRGEPSPLPELPLQYADFARWQRGWMQGEVLEEQLAWWRDQLAGAPRVLELPTDRPRPAVPTFRGAALPILFSPARSEEIRELGRREGATPFMILLAAWAVLLGRHTGQDEVLVGTPVSGRNRREIEDLIGFFVNTLVLRAQTSPPSFRELLKRVRETALDAFSHQEVPFERLVEELVPERDLTHSPLFQSAFALDNVAARDLSLPGLSLEQLDVSTQSSKFELTLALGEGADVFFGSLEHSTDLFDGSTAARLLVRFEVLLEAAVHHPERPPSALPLLSLAERHQTLLEWNDREKPCPQAPLVHELFSLHARRQPEAVAVDGVEGRLTYGALEARSNRLAHHLRRLGVGPEVPVALCAERTPERVIGIVAVLKAGGAYVSLDPTYPRDRLAFLLEDARAPVLLTQSRFLGTLPESAAQAICLDTDWMQIEGDDDHPPITGAGPHNLAYVVYTSGSTGRPKGVEIPHAGLMSLVRWHQDLYQVTPEDRATQIASPAFDASIWELWPYLAAGASVHIPDEETRLSAPGMIRWWSTQGITLAYLMTPLAEGVLEERIPEGSDLSLRALITGGDRLHRRPDPDDSRITFRLMNHYGPAEYTVVSTAVEVPPRRDESGLPTIGRPVDGTHVHLLDRHLEPVPIGVSGELFVAGVGIARGYLRRPDLTAERFLPNPFSAEPGARMYRTGDRVRALPDGDLDFLGRLDHQVKIRGIRIEPGEIEAALDRLPGVREAAVLVHEDAPGNRRLVAFVTRTPEAVSSPAELRSALRRTLPEAMVPSDIVTLESLPLTANGKVDRTALARITPIVVREEAHFTAPQGPTEEMLAGIWAEILGAGRLGPAPRVGARDDFFGLGGHSLLATRVIARVREAFSVELPLRALFEAPTVAELAARIEQEGSGRSRPLGPIRPIDRASLADLPLSFAQQRLWFLDRLAPGNPFYNVYNPLRLSGALDVEALRRAFQEIVRRQEALRTTFPETNGRPRQVTAATAVFHLPLVDLETLPEAGGRAELARLSRDEAQRPFDLARGPLFRATLLRHDLSERRATGAPPAREHTLLVNLHHIVSDGWSRSILFSEVAALYGAFSQGAPSPLPELPIQYADFAVWQRELLQGERLEAELGYWRQQLAGIPETLEIPSDQPRPAVESFRGAVQTFALPAPLVRALTGLTRQHGATRSMTMLAGFQALLGRYAGQDDVVVGMAIANRTRREVEGLIGFFVNTLVLRSDLSGPSGFGRLLDQVRETSLAAYSHQDVPFERLVEELQPERASNRNPLIQVMFGYQNFPRTQAEVQGLVLSVPQESRVETGTAKFDLTLFLFEDGDRLEGALEYNSEIFDAATVRRLLAGYESLLAAAVASPEVPVLQLPLLTPAERQSLLLEHNDTGSAYPASASLQELFATQVRQTPDAPAVVFEDATLTYAELDRRARHLAQRLRGLGAGPGSRVGLCIERSLEMVIGLVGIVQAGGAYVPLDPEYPAERLDFLKDDAGVRWVVGGDLTPNPSPIAPPATGRGAPPPVGSEALAYIIYTSGSTGRPKGVAVPHRAVVRLVRETDYVQFGPGDRVAQVANVNFDAATWEIWGPLLNGGAVVVIPRDVALSSTGFAAALRRQQITSLFLTTALFNKIAREVPDAFHTLRELLFGGEASDPAAARAVLAAGPPRRLLHVYGPTESTTYASWHPVRDVPPGAVTLPIGAPLANTTLYVLDRWQEPVPQGAVGELCIGGDGLAWGYWQRPVLTAERFVPDPFGDGTTPGARLYRTGDLVRHRANGALEFRGRLDHQVKIRGFRIELGEIESRLAEHPAVLQSLVLAREDVPGDRRLVAYLVQNNTVQNAVQDEPDDVEGWSELFDDIYRQEATGADPTFNIIGWNSTYTGQPLPRHEMEEWLEDTIGRIGTLAPRRVLEIGCGTGMILFKIAPGAELYTGTDVSAKALGYIESQLGRVEGIDPSRVQLVQGSAEDLGDLEAGSFDTAIVNSVAQYFPSADYLAAVVERAVELVRSGGAIFLGDLRSLPLLEAFHTSLELFQAEPEMPLPRLREKIRSRRLHENELVIDPAFFTALRQRLPRIARVEIHPKRGHAHNELTGFRYQAVLRIGEPVEARKISWLDWQEERLTLTGLRRLLVQGGPEVLALRNVPNARTAEAAAVVRLLRDGDEGIANAGDLRRRAAEAAAGAIDPQDLWELAAELSYEIELSWASPGGTGGFEAVLRRNRTDREVPLHALLPEPEAPHVDLHGLTNNPLQGQFARRIAPELRAFLKDRLPEYMMPSSFVLLDAFPLTPNGKIDRRRLPAPDGARPEAGPSLVAPRNPTEEKLLEIWKDLLGTARIGIHDDFFELGGHSLLATQAVSRVREAFGMELPLRAFFEASSVAAVAAEVEALRHADGEAAAPPIVPVPRDGRLPLSFAQERLWFLQRLEARSLAYNESAAFRMEGRLDAAAFRWSLDELLRRHESLRTTFPEVDGQAVQAIQPPAPFEIPSVDLRALPPAVRGEEARNLALGQALRPFDLERGPLVRGLLVRLDEREHAVLFSFHHIVFDGWSTGIFIRELSALYGARIAGRPSPLPPLAVQYVDFAAWQRRWLQGEILEQQIAWWRDRLAGVPVLDLPTDRPRPVLAQAVSGQRSLVLPPALTEALRELSRRRGTTLFMTLLAAFQTLLHRITGQDDLAVGTPIANRNRGEVEPLIGFFVNMLVLRTGLAGDPGFTDLLERVRQTALGAYAHQDLPFEKLVEELRPARSLRHTPLFQVSFQLLNVPTSSLSLPGIALHPFPFAVRSTKFDLTLNWTDLGDRLSGLLDYDTDLFDVTTVDRLLAHLTRLAEGAAASPGTRLSELPLLTPAEHSQVLVEWNDTARAFEEESLCLHHRIARQVLRAPDAEAVVCGGRRLTFGELGRRAAGVAGRLRELGVGPEIRVALFLDRSVESVAALLGVLTAGGAYVPVDPAYPAERIAWLLDDSRTPVVVTTSALAGRLPAGTRTLLVEEVPESTATFDGGAGPDHPAYVIYTSGSTGRPKGVVIRHGAVMNLAHALRTTIYAGREAPLRVAVNATFSFDASVQQIVQLAWGCSLHILPQEVRLDPAALVDTVRRDRIDVLDCTPSQLRALLHAGLCAGDAAPALVLVGGEAVDADLRDAALAWPRTRFWNLYGPTECTVDTTVALLVEGLPASRIGRPLQNARTYVVTRTGSLAPTSVPGELQVGGAGLARGYLNRPDLTAERFVPDPFGGVGGRLYRSGDLVRWLPDGSLDFLGRLDHQVKVRGFRIELGEIEAALTAQPGVREAVVVAREDRLVAYVTGEAAVDELRRSLREKLPDYMVPAAFVTLDTLPLTPNRKVDRNALPAPERPQAEEGHLAPRTPVEEILAEIWAELLGFERIGVQDNFFDCGGHSLLAVLLMARIEQRLGKAIPLGALFAAPTVEALAALVAQTGSDTPGRRRPPLVAIRPQGNRTPFFCVHPVGGNVFCYLDLAHHLGPDQPFYAFQSPGPERIGIEQMAALYLEELRRIQPEGPYRLGGWSLGGLIAFEMARQLARDGETPELVALIDSVPPSLAPAQPLSEDELAASFARDLARLLGREAGISPEELRSPQIEPLFATFAANLQAGRAYEPGPYPGRLTLWLSEQTLAVVPGLPAAWSRLAAGGVETSTLPGDHYSLLRQPGVERLAQELKGRLHR